MDAAAMAGLAALLGVVAGSILGRVVHDLTGGRIAPLISGDVELARIALMVTVLSALPGAAARGLVRVDLLAGSLPGPVARLLDRAWSLTLGLVAGTVAWLFAETAVSQVRSGEVTQVLALPLWPVTVYGSATLLLLSLTQMTQALGLSAEAS